MATLLCFGSDPGAKNHLRPFSASAAAAGHQTHWIAPAAGGAFDARAPDLVLLGCSTDQSEWPLVAEAARRGVPSAMVVEIGVGFRFDGIAAAAFPDHFLVTNEACRAELIERGAAPDAVHLTGSVHLEQVAAAGGAIGARDVKHSYGLAADARLLSFFGAPADEVAEATGRLIELFPHAFRQPTTLIVRPHPRTTTAQLAQVRRACAAAPGVVFDPDSDVDTVSLAAASAHTLTMASTVSLESIALGVPSAFFQVGWDYVELDGLFANAAAVPRLRDSGALARFAEARQPENKAGIEAWDGALAKSWRVIDLMLG